MKIFLSGTENITNFIDYKMKFNLNSFFYARKNIPLFKKVRDNTELLLVDSGAFSFLTGNHNINWDKYVDEYIEFIQEIKSDNILGYIEMDVDRIIGLPRVEEYRKKINKASDGKVIPVWHKERGIENFKNMCKEHSGGVIAVVGRKDIDILDHQFNIFLEYAWSKGCRIHALAMTKKKIIDKVPFDYVDSTSWLLGAMRYGRLEGKKLNWLDTEKRKELMVYLYRQGMNQQTYYENKWKYYEDSWKKGLKEDVCLLQKETQE